MSFPRKRESSENNKKYWIPSQAGNDIRGIILYENYNNMELYLGGGHNKSYNLNIIKHYKEMSPIFLTLPRNIAITIDDIPDVDGDGLPDDITGDGIVNEDDLALYLETNCTQIVGEWVFSVADLVSVNHTITNENVKLMKLRFYPVATTEWNG